MIEVEYTDRLGNNLFQYCYGRLLAEHFGYRLCAPPIRGFSATTAAVDGLCVETPVAYVDDKTDLDALRADLQPRRLVLRGYFQQYRLYGPHQASVREWLRPDERAIHSLPGDSEIWVHVRRGDYLGWNSALPFSYYEAAIDALGGGPVRIVTDDPSDPFFRRFRRFDAEIVRGSALDDFYRLTRARRIVLSQSSFSWWAAFLSNAVSIAFPLPLEGFWSSASALEVPESRYTYLKCGERYVPTFSESMHFKALQMRVRIASIRDRVRGRFQRPFTQEL